MHKIKIFAYGKEVKPPIQITQKILGVFLVMSAGFDSVAI